MYKSIRIAVKQNNISEISELEFDPNLVFYPDLIVTILLYAVYEESFNVCKFILDRGANVDTSDKWNCTALMHAIRVKNISIFQLLLERNADVNKRDNDNKTALTHAVCHGNSDMCRLLLDKEADLQIADFQCLELIKAMRCDSNFDVCNLLLQRMLQITDKTTIANCCSTALISAARNPEIDLEICKQLIRHEANPNYHDDRFEDDFQAIQLATHLGNSKLFNFLVMLPGFDITVSFDYDETILHKACRFKDIKVAEILIENLPETKVFQLNKGNNSALQVWSIRFINDDNTSEEDKEKDKSYLDLKKLITEMFSDMT